MATFFVFCVRGTTFSSLYARGHTHTRARAHERERERKIMKRSSSNSTLSMLSEAPLLALPGAQKKQKGKDLWLDNGAVVVVVRRPG
jgi:hypothetical protein